MKLKRTVRALAIALMITSMHVSAEVSEKTVGEHIAAAVVGAGTGYICREIDKVLWNAAQITIKRGFSIDIKVVDTKFFAFILCNWFSWLCTRHFIVYGDSRDTKEKKDSLWKTATAASWLSYLGSWYGNL
jgi:hypothetical protein